jgi:alkanesulfonate monooxygenase SsuD/methylene tetrahydromethanopterin reductase-like flavin-dependent oxidoreductase (luciferase family)
VGVPFEERWQRFEEAVSATRALLLGGSFEGHFYAVEGPLEPLSAQPSGPPLWVGSWGSDAGLRRAVRLGDGWLASAYNITPGQFRDRWDMVQKLLGEARRDPADFANGIATMWFHIDDRRANDVLEERLAPVIHRPSEQLRERLAFGPAEAVVEKLIAFPRCRRAVDVPVAGRRRHRATSAVRRSGHAPVAGISVRLRAQADWSAESR